MSSQAFETHDHFACIADGLTAATRHCEENGLRFTRARRRVLEILLEEHRAMGAYEILERLRAEGIGSQPPVAYRALEFLVKHGFAHRIERQNAFIACTHIAARHTPMFLICSSYDAILEIACPDAGGELDKAANRSGFAIKRTIREAEGVCRQCQAGGTV